MPPTRVNFQLYKEYDKKKSNFLWNSLKFSCEIICLLAEVKVNFESSTIEFNNIRLWMIHRNSVNYVGKAEKFHINVYINPAVKRMYEGRVIMI